MLQQKSSQSLAADQINRRITLRLLPFLMLLYIVAFLDRVNVGFAALSMNKALGITDTFFGLAAGMFFVGYLFFEVPSNLLLNRFGARVWIARIMITWGLLSIGMAFVRGSGSYIVMRFLLGAAEAGFFPGVILYLTFWLPASRRAGVLSLFVFAIPLANVIGGPISSAVLRMGDRAGLHDWQWLFLLEGAPSVILGCLVPWVLVDRPEHASWLTSEEKTLVADALVVETSAAPQTFAQAKPAFFGPVFVLLTFIYFTLMTGLYGLGFWLPRILQRAGSSPQNLGWDTALTYAIGGLLGVGWAYHSDQSGERRWHLVTSLVAAALGVAFVSLFPSRLGSMLGFTCSAAGIFSAMPLFWTVATRGTAGAKAAMGIAIVNSVGNLGGFVGPSWMGWMSKVTSSFAVGLLSIAVVLLAGTVAVWRVTSRWNPAFTSLPGPEAGGPD